MSAGRDLSKRAIDMAADLRRYATTLGDFNSTETHLIISEALTLARRLEALVPTVLAFEGETRPELPPGGPTTSIVLTLDEP